MTDQTRNGERELKPCPFCGSPAELERGGDHHGKWFNLGCSDHWGKRSDGGGCIGGRLFYTADLAEEPVAISAWNTRHGEALAAQGGGE